MNARSIAPLAALGALVPMAFAQENIAYSIAYSNPTLAPGQVQHITVTLTMSPDIGGPAIWNTNGGTGQTGTLYDFAATSFDIINVANGETGVFANPLINPWFGIAGLSGHALSGGWYGAQGGQIVFPPIIPGYQHNPLDFFTINWAPSSYVPRKVAFDTRLPAGYHNQVFLEVPGFPVPVGDNWTDSHGEAEFTIIPAPAGAALVAFGAAATRRRSRRRVPP